jgi:pimeloyl-ACP methyl ester carboxylesterase
MRKEREMQKVTPPIVPNDIDKYVTHEYADNRRVNIHYASIGEGPLIVMIHGFPDFWYTWRNQMREHYLEAFRRSDFEAMLHYYKQNYPRPPYQEVSSPVIKVQASVLQIHGLQDPFLLPAGLNNTWEWLENDWTLLTIPQAGHFVQHDATDLVTRTMVNWLAR